jgi:predicted Zn-dependent protease
MERLVPRRLVVALALGWCALAAARAPEWPLANQELIHNARFWEAHDRDDLAQLALKKLVAARPDLPEALLELGELDLRLNDFAAAREVESELARRFPGSESARDFATEVRVATRDRLELASIRRLIEIGRTSEARAQLKRVFPQGPPGGALGIDYYLLLAQTPGGMAPARAGLRHLAESHGGDPRYQLALARLLVRQRDSALEGVTLLEQLTRREDVRREDADRLLASGLLRLGPERAPAAAVDAYLARHPEDVEIAGLRDERERLQEERGLLVPAALSKALPALQRRLERDLSSAGSVSVEVRAEARRWLDRSRTALERGEEPRAALELRAALAFFRGNYEAEIGIAKDLETSQFDAEAGELLAAAVRLAPASSWLFETRVRWLIAHGDSAAAMELIRSRPLTATWTAAARDTLLAAALDRRASDETSAGQPAAAAADLEAAIPLAPRDPWLRYRLAELYRDRGETQRGRSLMSDGVARAPDLPDMRYAQALYLSHLDDYAAALAAIDGVDAPRRTEGMNALHDRMQVALARDSARRLAQAGDPEAARAALLDAEPVAARSFDRAVELAHSWIDLGDAAHGIGLVEPYLERAGGHDAHILLGWAEVLSSAGEDARLRLALAQLHAQPSLGAEQGAEVRRLERALDLREIQELERQKKFADAARRLDALLAAEPHDRQLRVARAELDLMAGRPRAARDRLASLTAEDPDDLDVRLSYVRALTESGDVALARAQLEAVEAHMSSGDAELELSLARRQLALGAPGKALHTLEPLLAVARPRTDVLMLAGRAQLALHHLREARGCFDRAAQAATGADALAARRESQQVEERLQSSVTGGLLVWHQPGSPGMSQIDAATLPSAWVLAQSDGARFIARADAVWLDAGSWSAAAEPLLGTVELAAAGAPLRSTSYTQEGLSPALGYQTDSLALDVGATPLGFLLPNVVGGIEWTPTWRSVDLTLGIARRALTSSELSYAGLKDPVTGTSWGGVVQTGPYAGFGIYRESYAVSGSVRFSEITGTRVPDNQLAAARLGTSWKFLSGEGMHADAGVTINYWNYERNLSNYTFGSGGYYSPQSYLSLSTPVELTGERAGWSYRLRGAVSYTVSQVSSIAFYPDDTALEAEAARSPLPAGYSSPYYPGYHSSGFGFSAYAAAERQLSEALVFGVVADIDRTDYYHPTSIGVYFRHAFGTGATRSASPPRPIVPYNP